jgi:hypothetical protein
MKQKRNVMPTLTNMPLGSDAPKPKSRRGFAGMSLEKRTAIAAKGGASVPAFKRAYSKSNDLARRAGAKGGAARGKRKRKEQEALQRQAGSITNGLR